VNPGKIAVITFIFLSSFISMQAQWEVGGLIGINFTSISVNPGSSSEDYSGRTGFGIGLVADRPLTDQISLHVEPMFLQKGGNINTSFVELAFKVSYFEIPIMVKYDFQINSSLTPYAMAGPSLGFRTGAKYKSKEGEVQDEKDNTNVFDFGVGFGGGVSLPHENLTFFAEIRYVLGLTNINNESDESTVKNRGLQVFVGVTVPLPSK